MSRKSLDAMIKEEVVKWDCYKNSKLSELIYAEFTKSLSSRKRKNDKKVNNNKMKKK